MESKKQIKNKNKNKKEQVQANSSVKSIVKGKMQWIVLVISTDTVIEFFKLWPLEQWVSSLVGLVLLYWWTTKLYNKRLEYYDLVMSVKFRCWMIASDLLINLALGLYYIGYRETVMGQLMIKCPIAVSPLIFLIEFLIVVGFFEVLIRSR